jgi:hypothetical protein
MVYLWEALVFQPLDDREPVRGSRPPRILREVAAAATGPQGAGKPCRCGHGRTAHQHYRSGTDCALCTCARFSRPLLARLRLTAS